MATWSMSYQENPPNEWTPKIRVYSEATGEAVSAWQFDVDPWGSREDADELFRRLNCLVMNVYD
jgi:hypothetical protein